MVIPKDGIVMVRPLGPHQYDVVPDPENPEKPYAYIMNVWSLDMDKSTRENSLDEYASNYSFNDRGNQSIADDNDREALQQRYVVWTKDLHFTMDGRGNVVNEGGFMPNPIGELPFIDIALEKDFQFFVRRGSSVTEFAIDFGLMLSDLSNISRLQGYSQAVISSSEVPQNLTIGPNHVLFLQQDESRPEIQPSFSFVSPSPDLNGSLSILETQLRLFLSSEGLDPATVSGKGEAKSFSSGIERLLSMLDKFEASRADFDLFRGVEEDLFHLLRLWSNELQGVRENGLRDELSGPRLSDKVNVDVKFKEPGVVRTQTEREDAAMKLLDAGLMTRKEALMEIRGISEEMAEEIIADLDEESEANTPKQLMGFMGVGNGEVTEGDNENSEEEQPEVEGES